MIAKMISKQQIKLVHTAGHKLGWKADGTYYDILAAHGGVTSTKDLTPEGYRRVMAHAQQCGFRPHERARQVLRYEHLGLRPQMATPSQLRKIEAIWRTRARQGQSDKSLRRFLKNRFGVESMEWVRADAVTAILRAMENLEPGYVPSGLRRGKPDCAKSTPRQAGSPATPEGYAAASEERQDGAGIFIYD